MTRPLPLRLSAVAALPIQGRLQTGSSSIWTFLAFLLLTTSVGCSDDATSAGKDANSAGDVSGADAGGDGIALLDGQICAPGSTDGCQTASHVRRCSADGTGWQIEKCTDDSGNTTECKEPGVCAVCTPGSYRCDPLDSVQVQVCSGQGQWSKDAICDASKGQQCVGGGKCESACTFNAKAKSYAGCYFWATDLDNAFVPGGTRSYYDAANAQYAIVIANTTDKLISTIQVQSNSGVQENDSKDVPLDYSPLQPGELRVFNLPPRNINATTVEPLAWRVTSTAPVAAYQFNPLENVNVYSNDASLLLPDEVLGKYYIAMSREQSFTILRGFVTVVASKPGITKVTVTFGPKIGKTLPGTQKKLSADGTKVEELPIKSYKSGEAATFELTQWDVLNLESDQVGADVTGTIVQASKEVAVFAGSEAANAPNTNHCNVDKCSDDQVAKGDKCGVCAWDSKTPCNNNEHCSQFITCCADHLEMQMFPVKNWGSRYVAAKLKPRGQESDSWRILAATDGTKVAMVPAQKDPYTGKPINVPVLNAGEWFEFEAGKGEVGGSFEIVAQHQDGSPAPIMVGHFMQSQDSPGPGAQQGDAGTGDPAFLLAIPVEQWREDYAFLTPNKYAENYISIAAPVHRSCGPLTAQKGKDCSTDEECFDPGQTPVAGSCIDDVMVTFDDALIPPDSWKPINKNFKMTQQFVNPGVHRVKALAVKDASGVLTARRVAVDVYGFDQYVSYGYPAGLDLQDLTLFKEPGD